MRLWDLVTGQEILELEGSTGGLTCVAFSPKGKFLATAGVEVVYRNFPDMVHGFVLFGGVVDTANAAVAECCERLRGAFEKVIA